MGVFTHSLSLTSGTAGRFTGWYAQYFFASSVTTPLFFAMSPPMRSAVTGSPSFTHFSSDRDVLVGQLALRRHLVVLVLVVDRLEQQAVGGVLQVDRRAGVAALEDRLARW